MISYFIFSFPFNLSFKPFVSGIGLLCAPKSLIAIGKLGPFLFEADHCQLSPLYQLFILYGFFYFLIISFFFILKRVKEISKNDIFVIILIVLSSILIILPEIVYIKDIYPSHYRANTMFKLVYQGSIMLSISCGYIIIRIFSAVKKSKIDLNIFIGWSAVLLFLLFLVVVYPFLAVPSYYNNLQKYLGLDGTSYLKNIYPKDYEAINWLNKNIKGQPVILEAQGDSYTDYARVSSNTGLPTVLGWTVHEWLWRGSYEVPAPRIKDVENLYQSDNLNLVKSLIRKYKISLVFVGSLEIEKYKNLNENNFKKLGNLIYENGGTKIYKIKEI
ncbi:MAG: Chlor_Arch_YYY protein [uncultured bacterium]|nr:MAG: Chlor_Arch_YYY protein [uncultured bacterium]